MTDNILIGIILLLVGIVIFMVWSHHKQQSTLLKAILSKDVNEFVAATTPPKASKPKDHLIPLSQLSDEEYTTILNVK